MEDTLAALEALWALDELDDPLDTFHVRLFAPDGEPGEALHASTPEELLEALFARRLLRGRFHAAMKAEEQVYAMEVASLALVRSLQRGVIERWVARGNDLSSLDSQSRTALRRRLVGRLWRDRFNRPFWYWSMPMLVVARCETYAAVDKRPGENVFTIETASATAFLKSLVRARVISAFGAGHLP